MCAPNVRNRPTGCACRTASAASPTARRQAGLLSAEDQDWVDKASKIPLRQLFLPDMWRNTAVATFVACCCTTIYGTVGGWMPLYLAQERHWSTADLRHVLHLVGPGRLPRAARPPGWISDRFGRRPAFYVMLAEGAIFLTLWVYAKTDTELWIYGLLWSIGFLGFWAPSMILTAEVYPTRIRGVGNGFSWSIAWLVGFVLWPFVAVALAATHRLVRRGVPGHSGRDAADGRGHLGVHPGPCGQGTRRDQRVIRRARTAEQKAPPPLEGLGREADQGRGEGCVANPSLLPQGEGETVLRAQPMRSSRAPSRRSQGIAAAVCGVNWSTCAQNRLPWFMCFKCATSCAAT